MKTIVSHHIFSLIIWNALLVFILLLLKFEINVINIHFFYQQHLNYFFDHKSAFVRLLIIIKMESQTIDFLLDFRKYTTNIFNSTFK